MKVLADWMPDASMRRVIVHWTGGAYKASGLDRTHYHFLIEGDGNLVRGAHSIKGNVRPVKGRYAAHTLRCNTGSIGVSMCCMAGAREQPFNAGRYPMTIEQWRQMIHVVADLCRRYAISVTDKTVLSHAEVQPNLGRKQRGKWDFTRLAFAPSVVGARACGDKMRAEVSAVLNGQPAGDVSPDTDAAATRLEQPAQVPGRAGTVTAQTLNLRRAPDGEKIGTMPKDTRLTIHGADGDWLNVTTPYPATGWVAAAYVDID